uniref:Pre-mRNA-splicing factor ISY1 homolog n=1 Tax=Urocitellus parryii TaxID=9999 RepID=A0A8D2GS77_UROPR
AVFFFILPRTALARFRQAQLEEGKVKERRPFLASECTELPKAEKWRRQIIGEISKKVAQIQNAGLGEFRIRDLNDEINKLLREKGHWEVRIKELGGPDYGKVGPKMLDHEGKEVPGNRGYKYFGAAKDLPGVRELFEKEPLPPPRKTRAELMKAIDFEYYGYLDEDDGVIHPLLLVCSRERRPTGQRGEGGGGGGRGGGQHLRRHRGGGMARVPWVLTGLCSQRPEKLCPETRGQGSRPAASPAGCWSPEHHRGIPDSMAVGTPGMTSFPLKDGPFSWGRWSLNVILGALEAEAGGSPGGGQPQP